MGAENFETILKDLEDIKFPFVNDKRSQKPIQIFNDNMSVVDMGVSFKDTQKTRCMMSSSHYMRKGVLTCLCLIFF
jgi:hypothetical protein